MEASTTSWARGTVSLKARGGADINAVSADSKATPAEVRWTPWLGES